MPKDALAQRIELINIRPRPRVCPVACPLHPKSPHHNPTLSGGFVPPLILPNTSLLVVGIVPGDEEELGGVPFIGPSGRYADHAIHWASGGRSAYKFSKMNLVNCRTVKPGKTKDYINRTPPTAVEMRTCFQAHLRQVLKRKWKCVLLFGTDAYKFIIPTERTGDRSTRPMFDQFIKAMGHRLVFDIETYVDPKTGNIVKT